MRRYGLIPVFTLLFSLNASASFHLWELQEVSSNPDGTVQFAEFFTASGEQHVLGGQTLRAISADGTRTNNLVFPANLPSSATAGTTFLVATPGFETVPGGVTPDYIIPPCFLFTDGGSLDLIGAFAFGSYTNGQLPLDGFQSLAFPAKTIAINSPQNFSGTTGSVSLPVPGSDSVLWQGLYHNSTNLDPQAESIPHPNFLTNTFLEVNYDATNICVYFLTSSPAGDNTVTPKVRFFSSSESFVDAAFQANVVLEETNQFHNTPCIGPPGNKTNILDLWKATYVPPIGFTGEVFYAPQILLVDGEDVTDQLYLVREADTNNPMFSAVNDFYWKTNGQAFGPNPFDLDYSLVWTNPRPFELDFMYHNNPAESAPALEAVPGLTDTMFLQYNYTSNDASAVYMLAPPFSIQSLQTRFFFANGGGEIFRPGVFLTNVVIEATNAFHGLPASGAITLSVWCTEFFPPAGWESNSFFYANEITTPENDKIWMVEDFQNDPGGISVTNNWTTNPQFFNTEFPFDRDWGFAPTGPIARASVNCDFGYHNNTNLNPQVEQVPDGFGELFLEVDYTTTTTVFRILTPSPANLVPGESVDIELRTSWSSNGVDNFVTEFNDMSFVRNVTLNSGTPFHGLPLAGSQQLDLWEYAWTQPVDGGGAPFTNGVTVFYAVLLKTTFGPDLFQTGFKYFVGNADVNTPNNYPVDPQFSADSPIGNDYFYVNDFSLDQDSDGDGLTDAEELLLGTGVFDSDSDDDGLSDGEEVYLGTNPLLDTDFFKSDATAVATGELFSITFFARSNRQYDVQATVSPVDPAYSNVLSGLTTAGDNTNLTVNIPLSLNGTRSFRVIGHSQP